MEIQLSALDRIELLSGMKEQEKRVLVRRLLVEKYAKNALIIEKDQPPTRVFFLLAGRLRIVDFASDGREVGFDFIEPGSHFGELGIIDEKPRSATIVAAEPSVVASLNYVDAKFLMFSVPSVSERLIRQLAGLVRQNNRHILMLGHNSAQSRIAILLLRYASEIQGELIISNIPSQSEVATMANTTRETVSRTLNLLINKKIIEKNKNCVTIIDRQGLTDFTV